MLSSNKIERGKNQQALVKALRRVLRDIEADPKLQKQYPAVARLLSKARGLKHTILQKRKRRRAKNA